MPPNSLPRSRELCSKNPLSVVWAVTVMSDAGLPGRRGPAALNSGLPLFRVHGLSLNKPCLRAPVAAFPGLAWPAISRLGFGVPCGEYTPFLPHILRRISWAVITGLGPARLAPAKRESRWPHGLHLSQVPGRLPGDDGAGLPTWWITVQQVPGLRTRIRHMPRSRVVFACRKTFPANRQIPQPPPEDPRRPSSAVHTSRQAANSAGLIP